MRKLVYPVKIKSLEPIEGADRLKLARMEGHAWQAVVGKGDFHPGQRAVYFEIDSALPVGDERYAFLAGRCLKQWRQVDTVLAQCYRIRSMTLRGVLSQGLLMPFSAFPEIADAADGEDVTTRLHVAHYDDMAAEMFAILHPASEMKQKGLFPLWIPKTDEERIQNLADWPTKYEDLLWQVSVKVDGTSATYFRHAAMRPDDPFGVCSRNFELYPDAKNPYTEMLAKYDIFGKLGTLGRDIAIQGEIVGPGIQGNRDKLKERKLLVFRMWDIPNQRSLSTAECRGLCAELGLEHVPVVDPAVTLREIGGVDEILKFAEGLTDNGNEREGLVFKTVGNGIRLSFKAVSNRYLLKEGE